MMMKISLPDQFEAFVEAQVTSGRFASASDVVGEALRLMEQNAEIEAGRVAWLQEALRLGIESGDAGEVDIEDVIADARANLAWLKEAYQEGLASGDHGELDVEALKAECRAEFGNAAK